MLRLTMQEPWATALACFGKDVENRPWAPGPETIGRIVAFHAGLSDESWKAIAAGKPFKRHDGKPYVVPARVVQFARSSVKPMSGGKVVGVGRLKGWVAVGDETAASLRKAATIKLKLDDERMVWAFGLTEDEARAAVLGPWFIGPVGHVYEDQQALVQAVGPVEGSLGYRPLDRADVALVAAQMRGAM